MERNYLIFHRTWWKKNPNFPGGLEPEMGRKTLIGYAETQDQARKMCEEWQADFDRSHRSNKLSRKAEWTSHF